MKSSSTRSGPLCSGFWDTVRNNLTIREMTALMGGDGTMEQQTEKDFRFENDPQAEVFLLSEKTKEKAPSIAASCFFVVRLAHSYPNSLTNIPFVFSFRRKIGYFFRLFVWYIAPIT